VPVSFAAKESFGYSGFGHVDDFKIALVVISLPNGALWADVNKHAMMENDINFRRIEFSRQSKNSD
jgi:hypothetical protein